MNEAMRYGKVDLGLYDNGFAVYIYGDYIINAINIKETGRMIIHNNKLSDPKTVEKQISSYQIFEITLEERVRRLEQKLGTGQPTGSSLEERVWNLEMHC